MVQGQSSILTSVLNQSLNPPRSQSLLGVNSPLPAMDFFAFLEFVTFQCCEIMVGSVRTGNKLCTTCNDCVGNGRVSKDHYGHLNSTVEDRSNEGLVFPPELSAAFISSPSYFSPVSSMIE